MNKGFTFIEILVSLALIGIISICAVAPVVFVVKNVSSVQSQFGESSAVADTFNLIVRDVRSYLAVDRYYMVLYKRDKMGHISLDKLAVASSNSEKTYGIAGTYVYGIVEKDGLGLHSSKREGLYRWYFKGVRPEDLDLKDSLPMEKSALVLPGISSIKFEVYDDGKWKREYKGKVPPGIKITIKRDGVDYEYVDWFPQI